MTLYNPDQEDEDRQKQAAAGGVAFVLGLVVLPFSLVALAVIGLVGVAVNSIK